MFPLFFMPDSEVVEADKRKEKVRKLARKILEKYEGYWGPNELARLSSMKFWRERVF